MRLLRDLLLLALVSWAWPSWAQCPVSLSGVLTFPENGSSDVPTNVVARIEMPSAESPSETISWTVTNEQAVTIEGESSWDGLTATFRPDAPLEPGSTYWGTVTWRWGETLANLSFTTGDGPDDSRPRFDGITGISWAYRSAAWLQSECSQYRGGGHVITLDLAAAVDETSPRDLCYHVYRTQGPGLEVPRLESRTRLEGDSLRVFVPQGAGDGRHCFYAEVQDLAGRIDTNDAEACVEVKADSLFGNICSVAAPAPGPGGGALLIGAALVLVLAVRRRRARGG